MKRTEHLTGYIWAIKNPDNPDQYIYVGQSPQPQFTIRNMVLNPASPIAEVVNKLREIAPVGIEILGDIVEKRYQQALRIAAQGPTEEDIEYEAPPVPPGMFRLEWEILDEPPPRPDCFPLINQPSYRDAMQEGYSGNVYVAFEPLVPKWINRLKTQGHPLLNKPLGRKRIKPVKTTGASSDES